MSNISRFYNNVKCDISNNSNTSEKVNNTKNSYGFDNSRGYNLNDYIKKNLSESKIKKIYEKKEQGTGFSTAASSLTDTNISRFYNNVKWDISNNSNTLEKVKNTKK